MPYYQGDYYQGDYYQGDPGIFSFLGKAVGAAAGFIPGAGGVVGAMRKAFTPMFAGGARAIIPRVASVGKKVGGALIKHPVLSAAGAAGAIGLMGMGAGAGRMGGRRHARYGQPGEKGYHESKKHPGLWVRNRRMNVCNPRALRRSLRRAHGFAKLAMHTIHLIHPKKKGRFGGFKRRRKARV